MMLPIIFACVGVATFIFGLVLGGKVLFVGVNNSTSSFKLWTMAWVAMFLSKWTFLLHEYGSHSVGMDNGSVLQLIWVSLAVFLILISLFKVPPWQGFQATPLWIFLIYGVTGVAAAIFSPQPLFSIYKALLIVIDSIIAAGILAVMLRQKQHKSLLRIMIIALIIIMGIILIEAVMMQSKSFLPKPGIFGVMLYGFFPSMHPNELGMWAGILTVIAYVYWSSSNGKQRLAWLLIGVSIFIVFLLAQSRTAFISLVLSMPLALAYFAKSRAEAILKVALLLIILIVSVYTSILIGESGLASGTVVEYLQRGQKEGGLETLNDRVWAWTHIGWPLFLEAPLTGQGFDAAVRFSDEVAIGHLHNSYFQVLANSGLFGFIPWFFALLIGGVGIVKYTWKMRRSSMILRVEAFVPLLVLIGLALRTWTGTVLVSHAWSTMIFLAMVVDLYAYRKTTRNTTGEL